VKAHRTDESRDSRRNRDADKLADQGRLMYLTEYSVPPDQSLDEDERLAQPFEYPLDWNGDPGDPVHLDSVPHPSPGPRLGV